MENVRRSTDPIWSQSLHKVRKTVVLKDESVLYYLGSDDDEFAPTRGFVRGELMHLNHEPELPPQSILEEKAINHHSKSNHLICANELALAEDYARKRRGGRCLGRTDPIDGAQQ